MRTDKNLSRNQKHHYTSSKYSRCFDYSTTATVLMTLKSLNYTGNLASYFLLINSIIYWSYINTPCNHLRAPTSDTTCHTDSDDSCSCSCSCPCRQAPLPPPPPPPFPSPFSSPPLSTNTHRRVKTADPRLIFLINFFLDWACHPLRRSKAKAGEG